MNESEGSILTIEPKSKLQAEAEFKAALRQRRMLDGSTLPVKSTLPGDSHPAPKTKKKRKPPRSTSRIAEYQTLMARASRDAGRDVREFCLLLDEREIPVLETWRARWGVKSWTQAYGKVALRGAIRSAKSRYST